MKGGVFILAVLTIIFFVSVASANDVAYVYRKEFKIDQNFIDVFEAKGFNVDLIHEKNMPDDFSGYDFIFVGDDHLRLADKLPVEDNNAIVANYFHGDNWDLVDRDGVSQMGSTAPMKVVRDGVVMQVYTKAFLRGRIAVPYYYLERLNRLPEVVGVAGTMKTSSGERFGEVVAYLDRPSGARTCFFGIIESDFWTDDARDLLNDCVDFAVGGELPPQEEPECLESSDCSIGSTSDPFCFEGDVVEDVNSNVCESEMCVPNNRVNLVEVCGFGCSEGACLPEPAECETDLDCPADELSDLFCQETNSDENVYQDVTSYSCVEGSCVSDEDNILIEDCGLGCFEGGCIMEEPDIECSANSDCGVDGFVDSSFCSGGDVYQDYETFTCEYPGEEYSYCYSYTSEEFVEDCSYICGEGACVEEPVSEGVHDLSLVDFTNAVDKIKIIHDGEIILGNELQCNMDYKIYIRVENVGDFSEDATFEGSVGPVTFNHLPKNGLDHGVGSTKSKTVNLALEEGTYDIIVETFIDGFSDANPSDNVVSREVNIICED